MKKVKLIFSIIVLIFLCSGFLGIGMVDVSEYNNKVVLFWVVSDIMFIVLCIFYNFILYFEILMENYN